MPSFASLGKFFGRTASEAAGFAAGTAIAPTLHPVLQSVANAAWTLHPDKPVAAGVLALGVAKGQVPYDWAVAEAARTGIEKARFDHMVAIEDVGPPLGPAIEALRRGFLTEPQYRTTLNRHAIEATWWQALVDLRHALLSVADVANAVQQGHLPNPGVLPDIAPAVTPAQGSVQAIAPDQQPASQVPLTQIDLDPIEIAKGHGFELDDLRVLANLVGLPPPGEALLHMWNRNLIDEPSVDAGIREGHMKTKWAAADKRLRWAVLSGPDYAELRLREWITQQQMYEGGALTGHTTDQMDLLYKNRGRPATPRQIWLAIARKVTAPDYPDEPANGRLMSFHDHELAISRSNIRTEYAQPLYDIRFNYPPLFQLTRLVQSGAVSPEVAAEWAGYNLYHPDVIAALAAYWATVVPAGKGPSALAKSYTTSAIRDLSKSYVGGFVSRTTATAALAELGVSADDQAAVLAIWDTTREVTTKALTASELKKAAGATISYNAAKDALTAEGYDPEEIIALLGQPPANPNVV